MLSRILDCKPAEKVTGRGSAWRMVLDQHIAHVGQQDISLTASQIGIDWSPEFYIIQIYWDDDVPNLETLPQWHPVAL